MSGPLEPSDAPPDGVAARPWRGENDVAVVEVLTGRATEVGGVPVLRLLPKREQRTVGARCFVSRRRTQRIGIDARMR